MGEHSCRVCLKKKHNKNKQANKTHPKQLTGNLSY